MTETELQKRLSEKGVLRSAVSRMLRSLRRSNLAVGIDCMSGKRPETVWCLTVQGFERYNALRQDMDAVRRFPTEPGIPTASRVFRAKECVRWLG